MRRTLFFIILGITLFGAVIRCIDFPHIPPEMNRDEAALGYNAYSILKTGRDEWGVRYPIVFKSFGDYKLPGYIYTLVPFVAVFGLNVWAVRLPSLIAGIALIPLVFLLVKKLTSDDIWAALSSFLVAVVPWAIHYSRVGFEANMALAVFLAGMIFLLEKRKKVLHLVFALGLIFFSLLTYNTPLLLLPFILAIFYLAKKITFKEVGCVMAVGVIVFLLILPATQGKGQISIFSEAFDMGRKDLRVQHASSLPWRMYTNPVAYYPLLITQNYVNTFLPRFLVTVGGANPWHQIPSGSHFLWVEYGMFIFGFFLLLRSIRKKFSWVVLGLLAISPLPAAITTDAPHATRSLLTLLLICVVGGYGLAWLFKHIRFLFWLVVCGVLIGTIMYLQAYHTRFLERPQPEWNVGIREAIMKAENMRAPDETITIVGNIDYDYVYPLFYTMYNPTSFLHTDKVTSFGHYRFIHDEVGVKLPTIELSRVTVNEIPAYIVVDKRDRVH